MLPLTLARAVRNQVGKGRNSGARPPRKNYREKAPMKVMVELDLEQVTLILILLSLL